MRFIFTLVALVTVINAPAASAATTCSYSGTTLVVTLDDGLTHLHVADSGEIVVEHPAGASVTCSGGTPSVTTVDLIDVGGASSLQDTLRISLTNPFAPGTDEEHVGGLAEIEIHLTDVRAVELLGSDSAEEGDGDAMRIMGLVDMNADGDEDLIWLSEFGKLTVDGRAGNDELLGVGGGGPGAPSITLRGGAGNDALSGMDGPDVLVGGPGNDGIRGGAGRDVIQGGPGDDRESGDGGDDTFLQDASSNGADELDGGDGFDTLDYSKRTQAVIVAGGESGAVHGQQGEGDSFDLFTMERVKGGSGPDRLVAALDDYVRNVFVGGGGGDLLAGGAGNDDLFGGGGADDVRGGEDHDALSGDAGKDKLNGGPGPDLCEGGSGRDKIVSCVGN